MCNRHEVFSELLFGAKFFLILNEESGSRAGDDPLDELRTESRQSVAIGDHNCLDTAFLDVLQKPREAFALEVES